MKVFRKVFQKQSPLESVEFLGSTLQWVFEWIPGGISEAIFKEICEDTLGGILKKVY